MFSAIMILTLIAMSSAQKARIWPMSCKLLIQHHRATKEALRLAVQDALTALKKDHVVPQKFQISIIMADVNDDSDVVNATMMFRNKSIDAIFGPPSSNVAIVSQRTDLYCELGFIETNTLLRERGIQIWATMRTNYTDGVQVRRTLEQLEKSVRIVILCTGCNSKETLPFLLAADKAGMNNPKYAYIIPWFFVDTASSIKPWNQPGISADQALQYRRAFKHTVLVCAADFSQQNFKDFYYRIAAEAEQSRNMSTKSLPIDAAVAVASFRDSVYLYGIALNHSISLGQDPFDGFNVFHSILGKSFEGVVGNVSMDGNCERIPTYLVLKINSEYTENISYETIFEIGHGNLSNGSTMQITKKLSDPYWGTPGNVPPSAIPLCGFLSGVYESDEKYVLRKYIAWAVGSSGVVVLVVCMVGVLYYSKRQEEKTLLNSVWKIYLKDLKVTSQKRMGYSVTQSVLTHSSAITGSLFSVKQGTNVPAKYGDIGIYNGKIVAIQKLAKTGRIHLQTEKLHKLKAGLAYLHDSAVGYHGNLYIDNCLVNSRCITKLTDFGLNPIIDQFQRQGCVEKGFKRSLIQQLCTAPEVMREENNVDIKMADIYQVAMIAYQVLFSRAPFSMSNLSEEDILNRLKNGPNEIDGLTRPLLSQIPGFESQILMLIEACWSESPKSRLTAAQLKKELHMRTKHFGKNLIDYVMNMLETHATNLEKMVEERTQEINEERKRVDSLLYQILPKMIADRLKAGHSVDPEVFETSSIYFSDIVGFTTICSISEPKQIVAMLNILYSKMDEVILANDSYKVLTIGDAYLVVSGVPVRNGLKHVTNIADMSLNIMKAVQNYEIPHFPERKLNMRIGLHSGSVAGAVVGLTMPKYCLFGDSVNNAASMESTSKPGRIQMTEDMRCRLVQYAEYIIEKRGKIEIKDRGLCTTYWLLDKVTTSQ